MSPEDRAHSLEMFTTTRPLISYVILNYVGGSWKRRGLTQDDLWQMRRAHSHLSDEEFEELAAKDADEPLPPRF